MYEIVVSPAFKVCLDRLFSFLERKYSYEKARETKEKIRIAIEDKLGNNPQLAPVSSRLIDLGIGEFHQFVIDDHNLVFYRVDESNKQIRLLAVMDARQSIQKLLSEVMLRF